MNNGAFGENFPYTNFHDLNLDWIIKTIKELNDKFDEAISAKIKFADPVDWDITKQYEQLTIVIYENGAYLSMQPVPSGVNITDTDYWQNIFDMQELYDKIDDLDTELSGKIDDVEDALGDEIDELAGDVTEGLSNLNSITVKNNSAKHILWVGDSYSTWYSGALYNTFVNRVGVPSAHIHTVAESGAGFVSDGLATFISQVQGYTGNKQEITDIIICGGINDALPAYNSESADTSGLQTAITNFKTYCTTNYPNATLHTAYVGGCLPTSDYYVLHPAISQEWAMWAYTDFAGGHGYNVLYTWNIIHAASVNYHTDGLHPSEALGCPVIGEGVAAAFNDNALIYNRPRYAYNMAPTGVNQDYIAYNSYITNDILTIDIPDTYIQIKNGETIGAGQWYPVLTMGRFLVREPHQITVMAQIHGFAGMTSPKQVPVAVKIEDGVVSIKVFSLSGSTYETLTAGGFSPITFFGMVFQCPLWEAN